MGNRAVITTSKASDVSKTKDIGIYLHWNGGRDSVEAFLEYCELKGYRPPSTDGYGWARLAQVIGNFFGGSTSVGINTCDNLDCDNWDNGVYIIDGWKIVGRQFFDGSEQNSYERTDMLLDIDKAQPENEQLGKEFLTAEIVSVEDIKVGDKVLLVDDIYGRVEKYEVVGIGEDVVRNGRNVLGMPYVNKYFNDGSYDVNINNYITTETVRKVRENA
jgi:hypothetical protein